MPTLTASAPMSSSTARTWARMISGGTAWIALTPTVFWAVIAVIAVVPCTPQRANAFRSAWMPAPPPESEPAMASAVCTIGLGAGPDRPARALALREDRRAADRRDQQAAVLVAHLAAHHRRAPVAP